MRYFHRTSLPIPDVLTAADNFFAGRLPAQAKEPRRRVFGGPMGTCSISVRADGGHYTFITVETDQVGESEVDKLAKRFMASVHAQVDARHAVRGAY